MKGAEQWFPRRPGSAGSTRQPIDGKLLDDKKGVKNSEHLTIRGRTTSLGGVPLSKFIMFLLINKV